MDNRKDSWKLNIMGRLHWESSNWNQLKNYNLTGSLIYFKLLGRFLFESKYLVVHLSKWDISLFNFTHSCGNMIKSHKISNGYLPPIHNMMNNIEEIFQKHHQQMSERHLIVERSFLVQEGPTVKRVRNDNVMSIISWELRDKISKNTHIFLGHLHK